MDDFISNNNLNEIGDDFKFIGSQDSFVILHKPTNCRLLFITIYKVEVEKIYHSYVKHRV
jgi:hypothetical protein